MKFRRPNMSEVVAVTALVVASSGTAVAASRYLITSPSQIKPSVLRSIAHDTRGETAERSTPWTFSKAGIGVVGATASCPAGFEDVTGGYWADLPGSEWHVTSEERLPTGWSVTVTSSNPHPAQQVKLKVKAYCRSRA
jgi:hypothetical protein